MFLVSGIILLMVSIAIIVAIVFTAMGSVKKNNEIVISKKNLIYLAPTFILIYCLHVAAWLYNGNGLDFFSCFTLIGSVLEVILKFKVDTAIVLPICQAYPIFYVDFVFAYIAGGASVILSVASFFSPRIRNFFTRRKLLRKGCDIVIGDCSDSLKYLKANRDCLMLAPGIERNRYGELLKSQFTVLVCSLNELGKKLGSGEYNIIFFRGGNISYSKIIEEFIEVKRAGFRVTLSMEADQSEVKIVKERLIAEANGKVEAYMNCFSRHELVARQFVWQYPLTKYIPRSFYNENFSLKDDRELNIVFVGFGKMNYQIFRMCAMQFQFAVQHGRRFAVKPVHYYIYDNRDVALHNEFFSRIVYEFDEDFKNCDFPKPERICDIAEVKQLDINSVEARRKFRTLVKDNSYTYFIVSLNSDLEDASYAQTIKRILPEGGNYRIFVRTKSSAERFGDDGIIYFGDESGIYTHDCIVNDDLSELARRINMMYDTIENPPKWLIDMRKLPVEQQDAALSESLKDPVHRELMRAGWESRPMIEQASNLYHALNLPFKLNLLGFDMVKRGGVDDRGVSQDKFNERYVNSGKADNYSDVNFFFDTQSSNLLAFIEHSRWNALYILYDYTQMQKKDMVVKESEDKDGGVRLSVPHKDTVRKRHACLTTYYGLNELIRFKFGLMYPDEDFDAVPADDSRLRDLYNVYQYDYMDLDRLYSEITAMGYKLVEV